MEGNGGVSLGTLIQRSPAVVITRHSLLHYPLSSLAAVPKGGRRRIGRKTENVGYALWMSFSVYVRVCPYLCACVCVSRMCLQSP